MDIKFPQQENPFPKTLTTAIVSCIAALLIGLFLGNALGAFFGTDQDILNTSAYTDHMTAIKSMFTDTDQMNSYMETAQKFLDMDGLKLYSSKNRDHMLAYYEGQYYDAYELFGEDIQRSLHELMHTEDALYGQETTAGSPIEGVQLWNLTVQDGVVYYYLYYDEAGFIGIAYDHTEKALAEDKNGALQLTVKIKDVQGIWYIVYYMED